MRARIVSTVILWLAVALAVGFGGAWGGVVTLVLLGGAAQWEFYGIIAQLGAKPLRILGVLAGATVPVATFCKGAGLLGATEVNLVRLREDMAVFAGLGFFVAALFFAQLVRHARFSEFIRRTPTLFGVLGFPFMMSLYTWPAGVHWAYNHDMTGVLWVLWSAAVTKFADVGALLSGRVFGRNKLWPAVSPGKTREGCVGGVITSAVVGALLAWVFGKLGWWSLPLSPGKAALTAVPLAVFSVPSDLVESVFKRLVGRKDSGSTIPGIGGAYDLVDSLLFTAPASLALYLAVS